MLRVEVQGDKRVSKALRETGLKVGDLSAAWDKIGAAIQRDAVPLVPTLTGRLASTVRQGKTKSSATVRAGTNKTVPYAGVINYGWPAHNIEPSHFLNQALLRNADYAEQEVANEVMRVAERAGLL